MESLIKFFSILLETPFERLKMALVISESYWWRNYIRVSPLLAFSDGRTWTHLRHLHRATAEIIDNCEYGGARPVR